MLVLLRSLPRLFPNRPRRTWLSRTLPLALSTRSAGHLSLKPKPEDGADSIDLPAERQLPEHAVISTFDLFSIGGTPSAFRYAVL